MIVMIHIAVADPGGGGGRPQDSGLRKNGHGGGGVQFEILNIIQV